MLYTERCFFYDSVVVKLYNNYDAQTIVCYPDLAYLIMVGE